MSDSQLMGLLVHEEGNVGRDERVHASRQGTADTIAGAARAVLRTGIFKLTAKLMRRPPISFHRGGRGALKHKAAPQTAVTTAWWGRGATGGAPLAERCRSWARVAPALLGQATLAGCAGTALFTLHSWVSWPQERRPSSRCPLPPSFPPSLPSCLPAQRLRMCWKCV
jgi:hypothetical protein